MNRKLQAPSTKLQGNTKQQTPSDRTLGSAFEILDLELLWSLELGIWSFRQLRKIWQAAQKAEALISAAMDKQVTTLGAFSVSLAVKSLAASQAFYEKLGFKRVMGEPTQNWVVLRNGTITIGLFQGMFDRNTLTFNPGWTAECEALDEFTDVRQIQKELKAQGVALASEADESTTGPASLMLMDPDGNPVLIDQHVASPSNCAT